MDASPADSMKSAIDTAIMLSGIPAPPLDWTMTRARLVARAKQLAELLPGDLSDPVVSETELRDEARRLRGTPDIVVLGNPPTLIDLKTETLPAGELPEWIRFQLTMYAHLVETQHGSLPQTVSVFSLNRGPISYDITPEAVTDMLVAIDRARDADKKETRPSVEVCRFCRRRFECDPHWSAAQSWPDRDCVDGVVSQVERADNGRVTYQLSTVSGPVLVGQVPGDAPQAVVGDRLRLVRLYKRQGDYANREFWRWGTRSSLMRL